jgi:dolichol-phosphate mannosyltransferase
METHPAPHGNRLEASDAQGSRGSALCGAPESLLVAISTYNEADNVVAITRQVLAVDPTCDVLVVDDCSPDGTERVAREAFQGNPRVLVVRREGPRGRGRASVFAYHYFRDRPYRYLCEIDADFQEDPADIPRMLAVARSGGALVIGSRYVEGGCFRSRKKCISLLAYRALHLLFRTRIRDLTCSYHLMAREVFDAVPPETVGAHGFFVFAELHLSCERAGLAVREVPCHFPDRLGGRSKIGMGKIREFAGEALKYRWRSLWATPKARA